MSKYRKKPVVIEAVRVTPETMDEVCKFVDAGLLSDGKPEIVTKDGSWAGNPVDWQWVRIPTLEGEMLALPGDWIIKGVEGELYPCKPEIFEKTYEAVDDV